MARAQLLQFQVRSFEAHSRSYVTKMIDKNAPSGRVRSSRHSAAQTPSVPENFLKTCSLFTATPESRLPHSLLYSKTGFQPIALCEDKKPVLNIRVLSRLEQLR